MRRENYISLISVDNVSLCRIFLSFELPEIEILGNPIAVSEVTRAA